MTGWWCGGWASAQNCESQLGFFHLGMNNRNPVGRQKLEYWWVGFDEVSWKTTPLISVGTLPTLPHIFNMVIDSKLILLLSRSRNTSPNHLRLLHLIKQAAMSSESRTITVLPCIFRVGSKRKCGASSIHFRWNLCCSSYPKPSKVPQVAFPQQSQLNLTLQVAKDDMLQQALLGIASKNAAKGCHYAKGRHVWMQHLSAYADHLFVDAGPSLCTPNLFEVPLDCQSKSKQYQSNQVQLNNISECSFQWLALRTAETLFQADALLREHYLRFGLNRTILREDLCWTGLFDIQTPAFQIPCRCIRGAKRRRKQPSVVQHERPLVVSTKETSPTTAEESYAVTQHMKSSVWTLPVNFSAGQLAWWPSTRVVRAVGTWPRRTSPLNWFKNISCLASTVQGLRSVAFYPNIQSHTWQWHGMALAKMSNSWEVWCLVWNFWEVR